ncbi:hypothetical protein N510_001494 [Firmicutes bacterium ASF500]|nr:hypothetical protein N510_001494 [Firmicutes bacterium ASF500]
MKDFNRFYLWGVNTKYSMGLYFSAAVFVKGLVNVLMENWTIDVIILLEMLLACFAFACLESALFPYGKNLLAEKKRVAAWAVLANVIFIGCGWGLRWFPGLPLWGGLLLVLFLECGLGAMWYALYLNEKRDTAALNQGLRRFQGQNE